MMAGYTTSITLIISSFFTSLFIAIGSMDSAYSLLFLLPLTYAICVFLSSCSVTMKLSVTCMAFVFGAFFRMVLSPLLMMLSDFEITFGHYTTYLPSNEVERIMPETLLLMCYENITLFAAINYFYSDKRQLSFSEKIKTFKIKNGNLIYRCLVIFMIGFAAFALFRYSSFRDYVGFVWESDLAEIVEKDIRGESSSIVYRLFIWFVDILQMLLPITFVVTIKKMAISETIKTHMLMAVVLFTLVIMTENKIFSIMNAILLIFWYYKDKHGIPKTWYVIFCGIGAFAFFALLEKTLFTLDLSEERIVLLSGTVNAYFEGPYNVAASLLISRENCFETMFGDIANAIPFLPIFFKGMPTTKKLFNYLIKGPEAVETKVIPLIGQGAFYLTPVLAPVFIILVVYFARKWEEKSKFTRDNVDSYLYFLMALFAALSPCVFNGTVLIKNVCNIWIIKMLAAFRTEKNSSIQD